MTLEQQSRDAADAVAAWLTTVYTDLDTLAANIGDALSASKRNRTHLTIADLKSVRDVATAFLAANPTAEGAGVILSPGTVDATHGAIEWWRHSDDGPNSKVLFNLTPDSGSYYDFENLPWFETVARTGHRAITGPYMDYGGMDQYILTLTVPLYVNGTLVGMAGCDIEVRDLEKVMVPILRRIPGDAALVSEENIVVLGNSGRYLVGNRVRTIPADGGAVTLPLDDVTLTLVYAQHQDFA
ncbi:MAG: hypothetical protein RIS25_863 [Actinomycetota bacterium]|jgi:hypothetical protein